MKYWKASRPYSFTAAIVPVLLGTAVAQVQFPTLHLNWLNFLLVLIGCIGAQAISNLANDLVEVKTGFDKPGRKGRYHGILSGDSSWQEIFNLVVVIGAISLAIGIYLASQVGWSLLWLILISAFLAVEYTAPPLKLKYHALGDVTVLLTFGLGMVFGAYFVQAHAEPGALTAAPLLILLAVSLPSALHVIAILQANNHRDRDSDKAEGATTVANLLPFPLSKALLIGELTIPYFIVLIAWPSGWLTPYSLIIFLTLPFLLAILKPVFADDYKRTVPDVAKLHGQFGLLMTAAIVVQIALNRR